MPIKALVAAIAALAIAVGFTQSGWRDEEHARSQIPILDLGGG